MPDSFWTSEEYDEHAHELYNVGDLDGALEALKEGITLYPDAVELYVGLGYARLAREEFAWARRAFHQALQLEPDHEDAMVGMGEVLLRFGRTDEALRLFADVEAMGFDDDVELMLTMGRALYRSGAFSRARDVFGRLVAARPDSAEAVAALGYTLHRLGNEVEAARHLRRALKLYPALTEARIYLGHLLYERGDATSALREFERVPPADHWDSMAVYRLLELRAALQRTEQDDQALEVWRERLALLDEMEDDPIERLLAEIEDRMGATQPGWGMLDDSQLELFDSGTPPEPIRLTVRLPGGMVFRGDWLHVVRQMRDEAGFKHESVFVFMRRLAEGWHERAGVDVPSTDPEAFLRAAAEARLLNLEMDE
jgi:Flp pilus assembly protein TadD